MRGVVRRCGAHRVYLVNAAEFDGVARAHGTVFGSIRPANTTVVVAALLNPAWKVEVEAEAVLRS